MRVNEAEKNLRQVLVSSGNILHALQFSSSIQIPHLSLQCCNINYMYIGFSVLILNQSKLRFN